jgi:hypothetical protein
LTYHSPLLRDAAVLKILSFDNLLTQAQRQAQVQAAGDVPAEHSTLLELPKSLTRRFEVVIIPESHERPRKLREIKAQGKYIHINTYIN